ncbi:LacI family DNA-binding transcriptional regulator [Paraburkholderia sp. HD33-4]|uniref:LacI family DNA-binding transcriptional regulator n=1 Tax=Paraburkholderia sp. HD33-4 TaxID=2883242 RepID=UPI001F1FADF2|nr:LacI family DNA-binding transcriptional regulator [Paraburkholderia sp. HD33-4]
MPVRAAAIVVIYVSFEQIFVLSCQGMVLLARESVPPSDHIFLQDDMATTARRTPKTIASPSGSVSLHDVAKAVGCSPSTVSRALRTPEIVRDEVAQRIFAEVRRLGYTPNNAARALRSRRTRMIGAVLPTLEHAIYARLANSLENELARDGYSLIVTTSAFDARKESKQTQMMIERGAEGVVLVGDAHKKELYEFLQLRNVPYINTYVYSAGSGHPCVGFDNRRTATQIADYLLSLGHTEIAMITGISTDNDRVRQRIEGVTQALTAHGLSLSAGRIVEAPYTIAAGRNGMRRLLGQSVHPTAVICTSDILAFGCMSECAAAGISVPRDISIIGFDDLEFAPHLQPPLTTMQVPALEMGAQAGRYLIDVLEGKSPLDSVELEARLIIRGTTAQPPKSSARTAARDVTA